MQRSSTLDSWSTGDSLYQLTTSSVLANPYPFFEQIQRLGPLYFDETVQAYVCTNFQMGRDILQQAKHFGANTLSSPDARITDVLQRQLLVQEGDSSWHKHLRTLMQPTFRTSSYQLLQENVSRTCELLLDMVDASRPFDLIGEYAGLLPTHVSADLLGLPLNHLHRYLEWDEAYEHFLGLPMPDYELLPAVVPTMHEALDFLSAFVGSRRDVLKNSQVSDAQSITDRLLRNTFQGNEMEDADVVAQLVVLLAGGYKTAAHLIAMTLYWLQSSGQLSLVKENPTLIPHAVRECASFDGSSLFLARKARLDVALPGTMIYQGETVFVVLPAANRQWREHVGRSQFDCLNPVEQTLGFGAGGHICPGGPLAEFYAAIALGVLLRCFPDLSVQETSLRWSRLTSVRCPECMFVSPHSSIKEETLARKERQQ